MQSPDEKVCMNKIVCLLFCTLSFLRETVLSFCVVGPKHCENSLCWVGMYIKIICELIPHFNKVISLRDNRRSKKDLGVFCILFENPGCNKGDKGGIHSLFQNVGRSKSGSLGEYSRECDLHGSPARVPRCALKCASSSFFPCTYS